MSAITRILPKRRLSRWVGKFMHYRGPAWWAHLSIRAFASYYKINVGEAEKPLKAYASIGDFFIRHLKAGVRPVAQTWAVHPADSRITQSQVIDDGTLIQAKGITYRLQDFTQDSDCEKKWSGGFFLTYYLCPTDYHRVHSPVDGNIVSVRYMPGQLWPVNEWSTTN
ncbi:MAG TPA: phosphatidylserine decarboxylase, partial [Bdellovibrio sp.]|nr:phosphatidylserine decarboxylase [Bdellovibrio sp.]